MSMRIAIAQINTTVGDLTGNCKKILDSVAQAKKSDAQIVVFPEMTICGYPPEDLLLKEHFVQDNLKALRSLTRKIKEVTAIVGFVDTDKKKNLYNAAAVISNGQIKGVCHKKDLPNYGVFDEKRYFTEGQGCRLFRQGEVSVGLNICEDLWNKEGSYKEQVRSGANLIINISGSPYDVGKFEQRKKLLIKRAKTNKVCVCYANLVGGQDELVFDGGSLVVDYKGSIVASGKQFEEDLIITDMELMPVKKFVGGKGLKALAAIKQKKEIKALKPHLSKQFSQIERVYMALILGTRDYVHKNGFQKVAVGLSGGIDSSLVATIACKALGKDNVIGVSMPSQFSSQETQRDAKKLAGNLGIRFIEVPISGIFEKYREELQREFTGLPFGIAEENIQARVRGNILMAFSNKFGWMVLTTGNKSEVAVGYCTLYGDASGGFAVINDVPKTLVYKLAKFINAEEGSVIPESIISRAPSAELRENQKDQDSLPPYNDLDRILKAYVEEHRSFAKTGLLSKDKGMIKKIINMVDRSEYKRRQSPPGIKITPRAFGKDWRLPITNRYREF